LAHPCAKASADACLKSSESFILNDQSTPNKKCDFYWASFSMICTH
jgi:hypothetical protein